MSALDELLDLDNWRNDTSCYPSTAWYFTGDIDPKEAVAEWEEWRAELATANRAVEELNKRSESYELELAGYRLALQRLQEMLTAHPEKEQE